MHSFIVSCISIILFAPIFQTHVINPEIFKISSPDSSYSSGGQSVSIDIRLRVVSNNPNVPDQFVKCNENESKCPDDSTTNRYGLQCGKKFFNQAQIKDAADAACPYIGKNSQRHIFPAVHTAFKYHKNGPYVEWPIKRNGYIWNKMSRSRKRIVMTMDCTVVGGVIRKKDSAQYEECTYIAH